MGNTMHYATSPVKDVYFEKVARILDLCSGSKPAECVGCEIYKLCHERLSAWSERSVGNNYRLSNKDYFEILQELKERGCPVEG